MLATVFVRFLHFLPVIFLSALIEHLAIDRPEGFVERSFLDRVSIGFAEIYANFCLNPS